jgi:hypothetical protein
MLRSLGWNTPISSTSSITFALGNASEAVFKAEFPDAFTDVALSMDLDGATVTGHADGVVGDIVYELKSVSSTKVAIAVAVKREYKLGNALQLLGYMILAEKQKGILRYTNYLYHQCKVAKQDIKLAPCHIEFEVEITDEGNIKIDGKLQDFTVEDIVCSWATLAKHLQENTLPHIPAGGEVPFEGCCSFCKLLPHCKLASSVEDVVDGAKREGFIHSELTRA